MKLAPALVAVALTAAVPATASAQGGLAPIGSAPATTTHAAVPGEVIAQFESRVSPSARSNSRRAAEVGVVKAMVHRGQQLLRVRAGQTVDDAIRALERDPRVEYAQRNYTYQAAATPNDPLFRELWGLSNTGQVFRGSPGLTGTPGADIHAAAAWNRTTGSRKIVVAVADTGVAYDHPDLIDNIWANDDPVNGIDDDHNGFADDRRGWDFVDDDGDPYDLNEHGTHVAGTIGAEGDNGIAVAGVNWAVSIMPVRVLDASGSGTSQTIADGFAYAGDNGARVVNASLGGGGGVDQAMSAAIATHPDTLYVVAAGNGGDDQVGDDNDSEPLKPCNLPEDNIVCVAATTHTDGLADFSNFGLTSVDLGAPGTDILSTVPALVFRDGFETGLAKWTTTTWTRSGATSSDGSFSATDSVGDYTPGEIATLQTATAIPGSAGCPVSFDVRWLVPDPDERLYVDFSIDGIAWTEVGFLSGDRGTGFSSVGTAIPADADRFIRFRFVADGDAIVGDGVYLDNVKVGCVDASAVPAASDLAYFDGTSMATPQVAGAAALALSLAPDTTVETLKSTLLSTGDSIPALSGKTVSGKRLDVANLVDTLAPPPPPPPVGDSPPSGDGGTVPPPSGGDTTTPPNLLGAVTVKRCRQSGSGRKARLRCSLTRAGTVTSAGTRLKNRKKKTLAKSSGRPNAAGTVTLKLKRRLAKGRYTVEFALRDAAGHQRTLTFKLRIR